MKYRGIADVALVTNDLEKTVGFYRDVLGMSVVVTYAGDINGQRVRHYFFHLGPASCLSFFEWPGVDLLPRKDAGVPAAGRQFDHVTIGVDSEETLVDLQKQARKVGVQASDIVDHGFGRAIYFEDPNGISLGFVVWMRDLEMEPAFYDREPVPALRQIASYLLLGSSRLEAW